MSLREEIRNQWKKDGIDCHINSARDCGLLGLSTTDIDKLTTIIESNQDKYNDWLSDKKITNPTVNDMLDFAVEVEYL